MFKECYGQVPKLNVHGKKMQETDEFEYFVKKRIQTIIEDAG